MRRTVLVLGMMWVGCAGAPQADAGTPQNRPARIVSATPALRSRYYLSTTCLPLNPTFRLTVEDEEQDSLRSLWFIDQSASSVPFLPGPTSGGSTVQPVVPPSAVAFRSALENLPSGVHLVTVYVADSEFLEVVDGEIHVTRPGGTFDSFTWVLDVEPCP